MKFFYWLKNLLNISRPHIISIEYADCIFENQAYLLIQWRVANAYSIYIREIKYNSFQKNASAYLLIPDQLSQIQIKVSNSWKSETRSITLNRMDIPVQIDFEVKTNFKSIHTTKVSIAKPILQKITPNIKSINLKVKKNTDGLKINNLIYPD